MYAVNLLGFPLAFYLKISVSGLYRCQPCWKMAAIMGTCRGVWGQTCRIYLWLVRKGGKTLKTKSVEMQRRPDMILFIVQTENRVSSVLSVSIRNAKMVQTPEKAHGLMWHDRPESRFSANCLQICSSLMGYISRKLTYHWWIWISRVHVV